MDFRMLGPLEAREAGQPLPLGGAKQRALLALLLINANQVISSERLIDLLWPADPPDTARNVIQVYISQLRKILRQNTTPGSQPVLSTRPTGYLLELDRDSLDIARFESLAEAGHAALTQGQPIEAAELLDEALAEFRGEPLSDFTYESFAEQEIQRLREHRLVVEEDLFDARLDRESGASLIPEIERLVNEHPFRERLRGQLMLALYRSGRQADALAVYRAGAESLADELGIDPGPELQELHQRVLRQDTSLDLVAPSPDVTPPPPRVLEPQSHERVMVTAIVANREDASDADWAAAEHLVETSGGSVLASDEEQIVALLGFPRVTDDHAEQAVLVAFALAERGAGVAVATAKLPSATLAEASADSSVVVTARALAPTSGSVHVDAVAARRLRHQFSIVEVEGRLTITMAGAAGGEVPTSPLVGRDRELSRLDRLDSDLMSGRGQVLLIDGETGVGKSRLLQELRLLATDVHWVDASCSSSNALAPQPVLTQAFQDLADDQGSAAEPIGIAKVIESMAATAPVVLVMDDIQFIDPASASLLESLLPLTDRLPLCIAITLGRAEPAAWTSLIAVISTQFRHRLTQMELEPLTPDQTAALADALSPSGAVDPASRSDVVSRSGGNPLFVEQLIQSLVDDVGVASREGWTLALTTVGTLLPPLLEDVLAARMQRLDPAARNLAQAAGVLGEPASASDLHEMTGDADPSTAMVSLLNAEILVAAGRFPNVTYQFHHRLLQDAALSTLTPARARDLYRKAADLVERTAPRNDERIAFLRYRAHQWPEARERLNAAADRLETIDPARGAALREIADRAAGRQS